MTRPLIITTVGVIALAPLAGLLWWSSCPPPVADVWRSPAAVPAPVSEDPFDRTIAALTCGASPQEAADAIEFLDTTTRLGVALAAGRRSELISALERGTPSGMTTGTWAHLFNCACNALATGGATPDPKYIDLLERLAVNSISLSR